MFILTKPQIYSEVEFHLLTVSFKQHLRHSDDSFGFCYVIQYCTFHTVVGLIRAKSNSS